MRKSESIVYALRSQLKILIIRVNSSHSRHSCSIIGTRIYADAADLRG